MKAILTLLLLALASLALPSSSAALPIQCTAGPTAPGGDTHCEGEVVDCDVLVHVYDTEDALNHYKVACGCVAYDNYGRPAFRFDCYTPPPVASAAAAPQCEVDAFQGDCRVTAVCAFRHAYNSWIDWSHTTVDCSRYGCRADFDSTTQDEVDCLGHHYEGHTPLRSAPAPAPCTTAGGDTDCRVNAGGCEAHTHMYDVEDHPHIVEAGCGGCTVRFAGGLSTSGCELIGPQVASAAVPDVPLETHCVADDRGVAHCTTVVAGTCSYTTVGDQPAASTLACWHTAFGYCSLSPYQNPPNLWCEDYGPGDDDASAASAQAAQPCQTGIAQTWCDVAVGPCEVRLVPWTAWGDHYLVSDCHIGGGAGATCHTEVHTEGPLAHQHGCAW